MTEPPVLEVLPAKYPQTQYALGEEYVERTLVLRPQEPNRKRPDNSAPKEG